MKRRIIGNTTLLDHVCACLSEGRQVRIRAKGRSMRPCILDGDIVVISPVSQLCNGQIVLARTTDDTYVLHRIVAITPDLITLKGDGNLYRCEHCHPEDIRGTVTDILRRKRPWWRKILPAP